MKIGVTGYVIYRGWRDGQLVDSGRMGNAVVHAALNPITQILGGESASLLPITHIGWGAGTTATNPATTTALVDPRFIKPIDGVSFPSVTQVSFGFSLSTIEGNDFAPTEWALLQDDGFGGYQLFSRLVRPDFRKQVNVAYEGHWIIEFQP